MPRLLIAVLASLSLMLGAFDATAQSTKKRKKPAQEAELLGPVEDDGSKQFLESLLGTAANVAVDAALSRQGARVKNRNKVRKIPTTVRNTAVKKKRLCPDYTTPTPVPCGN